MLSGSFHRNNLRRKILLIIFLAPLFVNAQDSSLKIAPVDSSLKSPLQILIHSIQRGANDSVRIASNTIFKNYLDSVLRNPSSFSARFDSIKNVSIITDPQNKFRIYTWTVPRFDGDHYDYFGFIQIPEASGNTIQLIPLMDSTNSIQKPESEKLSAAKWYGAVYYSLVEKKVGKRTYYTLLGWKGMNAITTQKVAEVLILEKNIPRFGYPLFKTGKVYKNRLVFSFSSQATMALRYDESKNLIVFDHLSGNNSKNDMENPLNTSGPDGTYDALKFKSGKWILMNDVDVRTEWKAKKQEPNE